MAKRAFAFTSLRRSQRCSCGDAFHHLARNLPSNLRHPSAFDCDEDVPYHYWSNGVLDAIHVVLFDKKIHPERMNVFTHLVGSAIAALALGLTFLPGFLQNDSRVVYSRVAAALVVVTFVVSSMYHTLRTVRPSKIPFLSDVLFAVDQIAVLISMGASGLADCNAWTNGFPQSAWQTLADPLLAVAYVVIFLVVRHAFFDSTPWRYQNCSLGIVRFFTYDGLQAATLSSMSICIALSQFLPIAALFATASHEAAITALTMSAGAIGLLFLGQVMDLGQGTVLEDSAMTWPSIRAFVTSPASWGALCGGHAVWHVLAVFASLLSLFSREILLANS